MKLTLIKRFENGKEKRLFTIKAEEMDEFTITNFQDELDLELYLSNVSLDNSTNGRFLLVYINGKNQIEQKMFYRSDYDQFIEKLDSGVLNNPKFIEKLHNYCPKLNINNLSEKTIIRNFRNIYSAVREYSIERIETEQNKVKRI